MCACSNCLNFFPPLIAHGLQVQPELQVVVRTLVIGMNADRTSYMDNVLGYFEESSTVDNADSSLYTL
jgi:hypothetical protein